MVTTKMCYAFNLSACPYEGRSRISDISPLLYSLFVYGRSINGAVKTSFYL